MQSSHSPIILFPFSIKSLIKTSTQRVGSWCCKGREDVQMLRYCIWRGGAPNPQPKDTNVQPHFTQKQLHSEWNSSEHNCVLYMVKKPRCQIFCVYLLTDKIHLLDCSKGPGSFNRLEAGGRGIATICAFPFLNFFLLQSNLAKDWSCTGDLFLCDLSMTDLCNKISGKAYMLKRKLYHSTKEFRTKKEYENLTP